MNKENPVDYTERYLLDSGVEQSEAIVDREENGGVEVRIEETPLYQALKKYRFETSKMEGVHKENPVDYAGKYLLDGGAGELDGAIVDREENGGVEIGIEETLLYLALKQYRNETSKVEGIKAFYIFSNAQLEALIAGMPRSLDDLRKISGFGEVKCEKYGTAIIEIVDKYRGI